MPCTGKGGISTASVASQHPATHTLGRCASVFHHPESLIRDLSELIQNQCSGRYPNRYYPFQMVERFVHRFRSYGRRMFQALLFPSGSVDRRNNIIHLISGTQERKTVSSVCASSRDGAMISACLFSSSVNVVSKGSRNAGVYLIPWTKPETISLVVPASSTTCIHSTPSRYLYSIRHELRFHLCHLYSL